jgi:DNA-binding transcriptional MerR regulator
MEVKYAIRQLAKLAGVSVRTLHLYDQIGLLRPSVRTTSGYRQYGAAELLRLQQILFYKELDFPLKEIGPILDDPDFDHIKALEAHKTALVLRRDRLTTLLHTIDKTIVNLKNKTMSNYEELYEGMPREQATAMREEAIEKWGEDTVVKSEKALIEMSKKEREELKFNQKDIIRQLNTEFIRGAAAASEPVQQQIARHHDNIRGFWGMPSSEHIKAAKYKGLAELYVSDERYVADNGKPEPLFAAFMKRAMEYFADTNLK